MASDSVRHDEPLSSVAPSVNMGDIVGGDFRARKRVGQFFGRHVGAVDAANALGLSTAGRGNVVVARSAGAR